MKDPVDRLTDPDEVPLAALLREDFRIHGRTPASPGFHAIAVHRIYRRSQRLRGLSGKAVRAVCRTASNVVRNVYGIELPWTVTVGRRVELCHQSGLVVNQLCSIGNDCVLRHGVTLGLASLDRPREVPVLRDGVHVGPNAVIIGGIVVGEGARIGPLAHVISDVPPGASVLAPPATVRVPGEHRTLPPSNAERAS